MKTKAQIKAVIKEQRQNMLNSLNDAGSSTDIYKGIVIALERVVYEKLTARKVKKEMDFIMNNNNYSKKVTNGMMQSYEWVLRKD